MELLQSLLSELFHLESEAYGVECERYFENIVAETLHLRVDAESGVDTIGIYVENHDIGCREFFIWIRNDHREFCEKGSPPLLLDDPLVAETCPLEESASHHCVCITL